MSNIPNNILEIENLSIQYETIDGVVHAVNDVSLSLKAGYTLGLVGETGAGKTTLAKGIMRLIQCPPGKYTAGKILFDGHDILSAGKKELMDTRGKQISMIFQDPMTSLNPVLTVGYQIAEVIAQHENLTSKAAKQRTAEILEMVGIPGSRAEEYPHQFSGGMKQRVVIAIALACNPRLLIADEPTTALDVTIQAQLLELMRELRERLSTSMLLITHDLGVVAQNCDHVAIMYAGEIVEYGTLRDVFKNPCHPYTVGLFGSLPKLNEDVDRLQPIEGQMPDPTELPDHCRFADRCTHAMPQCFQIKPGMVSLAGEEHAARCFLFPIPDQEVAHDA